MPSEWADEPTNKEWHFDEDEEYGDPEDPLGYAMTYGPDGAPRLPYPHELPMGYRAGKPRKKKATGQKAQMPFHPRLLLVHQHSAIDHRPETPPTSNMDSSGPARPVASSWNYMGGKPVGNAGQRILPLPKPNKDFSVSERSDISTVIISEDGVEASRDSQRGPDIRNEIAPKHDIHIYDGRWMTHTWDGDGSKKVASQSYLQEFVYAWMELVPDDVEATFLRLEVDSHWHHDVDTETGRLSAAVDYPEAMPKLDLIGSELDPQLTFSSTLVVQETLQRLNKRYGDRQSLQPKLSLKLRPRAPGPPLGHPRIACYMRPAAEMDMEEVCQIYNLEVARTEGSAVDAQELTMREFAMLLKACVDEGMPFIVIVEGPASTAPLSSGPNMLGQYPQYRRGSQHSNKGKILGFGLISTFMAGITGSYNTVGNHIGRLMVVVHPSFRQKYLGANCVDKLLGLADPTHHEEAKCEFVDPTRGPASRGAMKPTHAFRHVLAEVPLWRGALTGLPQMTTLDNSHWLDKFFMQKFGFSKLSTLSNISGSHPANKPLDIVTYARTSGGGIHTSSI